MRDERRNFGNSLPRSKSWSSSYKFKIDELNLCATLSYHLKDTRQFQNITKTRIYRNFHHFSTMKHPQDHLSLGLTCHYVSCMIFSLTVTSKNTMQDF